MSGQTPHTQLTPRMCCWLKKIGYTRRHFYMMMMELALIISSRSGGVRRTGPNHFECCMFFGTGFKLPFTPSLSIIVSHALHLPSPWTRRARSSLFPLIVTPPACTSNRDRPCEHTLSAFACARGSRRLSREGKEIRNGSCEEVSGLQTQTPPPPAPPFSDLLADGDDSRVSS